MKDKPIRITRFSQVLELCECDKIDLCAHCTRGWKENGERKPCRLALCNLSYKKTVVEPASNAAYEFYHTHCNDSEFVFVFHETLRKILAEEWALKSDTTEIQKQHIEQIIK